MPELATPPTLGRYHLTKEVQRNGLGIVYAGVASGDSSPVLVHVIAPEISSNENFIIRFELLKSILPGIVHDNLVKVLDVGNERNIFFIAKELPATSLPELATLETFDVRDTPDRQYTLELLFHDIASGLAALEKIEHSYYRNGIIHDTLTPDRIFVSTEKSLVGNVTKPVSKLDGFSEAFLFFGDNANASHQYRMAMAAFHRQGDEAATPEAASLLSEEGLPPSWEGFYPLDTRWHQYTFGNLAYQYITGHPPKGRYLPIEEVDHALDPFWGETIDRCLAAPYGGGYDDMQQVADSFRVLLSKHDQQAPAVRRIKEQEIPEGMALLMLEDKVELGSADGPPEERPRFKARVRPFFIDTTPVTNKQFEAFLSDYQRSSYSRGDDHPATLTSWHMAKAYCRWRSTKESLPEGTYRLPTEYEWEAAVRGTTGYQYPWGSKSDPRRLHCSQTKEAGTKAVKGHLPGRFGLYDMLGNTWEWTESPFQSHPYSDHVEPGYSSGLYVVKGGCWFTPVSSCRASLRAAFPPSETRGNIGFRCVRHMES